MTMQLAKGGNAPLQLSSGEQARGVVVSVTWEFPSIEANLFSILCGANRRVRGEGDFLFWDQPSAPSGEAFLLEGMGRMTPGGDRAQAVLDLDGAAPDLDRISLALGTVDEGVTLRTLGRMKARVWDAHTGEVLVTYRNDDGYGDETCVVVWEVYRRKGEWKVKAVDQGWTDGVPALARAYGVDVV